MKIDLGIIPFENDMVSERYWLKTMRQHRAASVVFLSISLGKIILLTCLVGAGLFEPFVGDNAQDHYVPIANRLVAEGKFNDTQSRADSKVPIGYPAFLAGVIFLAPHRFVMLAVCLQMLFDMLVAFLIYAMSLQLTPSKSAGLAAGIIWLVFPAAIMVSTWITAETIFTALVVLSIFWLFVAIKNNGRALSFLGAGCILGLATLFRGTCLWLPVFLIPLWLWRPLERGLYKGCMFTLGAFIIVFPWTLRNILVLDDRIPVAVGAGSVFMQGSDETVFTIEGKHQNYPAMFAAAKQAGIDRPTSDKESAIDNWLFKVGLYNYENRARTRPGSFLPFVMHKFVRLWYGTERGGKVQQTALAIFSIILVPAGIFQIWRWRTKQPAVALLLGLVVIYFIALHLVTLPQYRYMHPLYPLLILSASILVTETCLRRTNVSLSAQTSPLAQLEAAAKNNSMMDEKVLKQEERIVLRG